MSRINPEHEALRDLLASYALDAVDETDAQMVEDHLRGCPPCRAELVAHRETAALLAHAGGEAPAGVWDRISAGISGAPPATSLSVTIGPEGRDLPPEKGRAPSAAGRRAWVVGGLAGAVAAGAIAVMGVTVARQSHRLDQLNAELTGQSLLRQATAAALDPRARRVALTSGARGTEAVAAVLPDGSGYLVAARMPSLPSSRTYQLWSIVDGRPVSEALLGAQPGVSRFTTPPGASLLAVTDEPAGGSARPTGRTVASGAL